MSDSPDASLAQTLDEAEWSWIKPHLLRDAVIFVENELDLLGVARALAADDSFQVQAWIQSGKIRKPSSEQVAQWDATPSKRFLSLVVQPYVLIQERLVH